MTVPPSSDSNDDDNDEYDLIIPKLVLFILIPVFIVMVIVVVVPIICLCCLRRHKLKNMKYRLRIAESARKGNDTLEQSRLTQGAYHNVYADTSFTTTGHSSQPMPQAYSQSSPSVPQWKPPVPPSQSSAPQWKPPEPRSQSPVPRSQSPVPRSQSPVPRSPPPPPPTSHRNKPPPPPPPSDELTPTQSTTDVIIEAPSSAGLTHRTSTISGAFDVLAVITAAETAKRRSTVSAGGGEMRPPVGESKLQRCASRGSAFNSLGRKEQPITPPSSPPPPPPPINGILPPPVAPKPKKQVNQLEAKNINEESEDTYEDTIANLEPLYEQIPGDQPEQEETDLVIIPPPPFEDIYDDNPGIHAIKFNASYDTYDVPTSQPASDNPTSQPGSYETYDVPTSQSASDNPASQPGSYETYDVPTSSNISPPPRPPKPSQNPLDRLVEEEDPINKFDADQEVCKINEMETTYEILDLNDND